MQLECRAYAAIIDASLPDPIHDPPLTPLKVEAMSRVAETKAVVVATAKTDCEELLVEIVQDKRVADEQEKQVSVRVYFKIDES